MAQVKREYIKRERKYDEIEKLRNDAKLSVAQAASLIGVSCATVYARIDSGFLKITFTRDLKKTRIIGSELKRYCRVN